MQPRKAKRESYVVSLRCRNDKVKGHESGRKKQVAASATRNQILHITRLRYPTTELRRRLSSRTHFWVLTAVYVGMCARFDPGKSCYASFLLQFVLFFHANIVYYCIYGSRPAKILIEGIKLYINKQINKQI